MGLFDKLTSVNKEKRTILYFKENGHFKFAKLEVEDTFLLERNNGRVTRAWQDLRRLRLPFPGWKGIPRDELTIAHSRDVIFDPFNTLTLADDPKLFAGKNGPGGIEGWLGETSRTQQYKRQEESSKRMAQTTQIILLAIPTILMGIGVLIVILVNMQR